MTPVTLVATTAVSKSTITSTPAHVKILTSTSMTAPKTCSSPNLPLARVPIPPCVTMQKPDIASYVPQQALPRYRSAPRKMDDSLGTSKIATYVRCEGGLRPAATVMRSITSLPTSRNVVTVVPPAVGATIALFKPAEPSLINSAVARSRVITLPPNGLSVVTTASPTVTTVVNKVTLPGRMPKIIDLTDDEQDRSNKRSAAAAAAAAASAAAAATAGVNATSSPTTSTATGRVSASTVAPKPLGSMMANSSSASNVMTGARLVAVKSTTLNGRFSAGSQNASVTGKVDGRSTSGTVKTLHPAPLPATPLGPINPAWKPTAPRPTLKISRVANGIVLSWTMQSVFPHAEIASYQLFAYQEGSAPASSSLWKRVGDVKALPLPMACTLTQFLEGHRYHFAVRAMDVHQRLGPYSEPASIVLS